MKWSCSLLTLICFSTLQAEPDKSKAKTYAQSLINHLSQKKFKEARTHFNQVMEKGISEKRLKELWENIEKGMGEFQKHQPLQIETIDKRLFVVATCEFANGSLDIKITFDDATKIAGFYFSPTKKVVKSPPPPYAKPESFEEIEITFGKKEWELPGTLTLPKSDKPVPAVILVHGSGPQDRDQTIGVNKPFRDFAMGLASKGIAVLRYDKRTLKHSVKVVQNYNTFTFREETIVDAIEAVHYLEKNNKIDNKKIYIAGHSLGAFVAPQILTDEPSIAGAIMLAAFARPLEDLIIDQYTYLFRTYPKTFGCRVFVSC